MPSPIDVANKFLVSVHSSGHIVVLNLPLQARAVSNPVDTATLKHWPAVAPLTTDEALNLAAWLVAVAQVGGATREDFDRLLHAVLNT